MSSRTEPLTTPAPIPLLERRLAPVMFALAFLYLLVIAGLIHRASQVEVTEWELEVMYAGLAVLWPIFAGEAVIAFLRRSPAVSTRTAGARALMVIFAPPTRLAWIHPATNQIWLPRLGWQSPGKELVKRLNRAFGGPMLLFAFLILPLLGLEYISSEMVKKTPAFALALDIGVAAIWLAFATEFLILASASPSPLKFAKDRWLDLAIVALPTLEFLLTRWVDAAPLARLFRLSRAVSPAQLSQMGRAYRLRGLLMKGWHAFLVLEVLGRVTGKTTEKRVRAIDAKIAQLEAEIEELRAERAEILASDNRVEAWREAPKEIVPSPSSSAPSEPAPAPSGLR